MAAVSGVDVRTVELATGPVRVFAAGAGPALLLLHHDFEAPGWGAFHEELQRRFTLYAPEMPGFGESARLDWARHPRDVAAVLLALARRLGLSDYVLAGLGFGGWVAAEMAAFAPTGIRHLVLVGAAGMKPDTSDILDQILMDHRDYVRAGFADPANFDRLYGPQRGPEQKARWEAARETIARITWKPYMYSYELPEILREMPVPTTVVWGTHDAVVPVRCASLYASTIPNAHVRLIEGGGHFLDLEQPAELAAIIAASAGKE
jgi:pimeloyl-ACP methyl ester carboxylesterase